MLKTCIYCCLSHFDPVFASSIDKTFCSLKDTDLVIISQKNWLFSLSLLGVEKLSGPFTYVSQPLSLLMWRSKSLQMQSEFVYQEVKEPLSSSCSWCSKTFYSATATKNCHSPVMSGIQHRKRTSEIKVISKMCHTDGLWLWQIFFKWV